MACCPCCPHIPYLPCDPAGPWPCWYVQYMDSLELGRGSAEGADDSAVDAGEGTVDDAVPADGAVDAAGSDAAASGDAAGVGADAGSTDTADTAVADDTADTADAVNGTAVADDADPASSAAGSASIHSTGVLYPAAPSIQSSYVGCAGAVPGTCNTLSCYLLMILILQCTSGALVLVNSTGLPGACHAGSLSILWCSMQLHCWRSATCGLFNCTAALSLIALSTLCYATLGASMAGYLLSGTCMALDALTMVLAAATCIPCHSACALQCACAGHVSLALSSAVLMTYHLMCVHGASHGHWYGASSTSPLCVGMLSTMLYDMAYAGACLACASSSSILCILSPAASGAAALPLCWLLGLCAAVAALPSQPILIPALLCPPSHGLAYMLLYL